MNAATIEQVRPTAGIPKRTNAPSALVFGEIGLVRSAGEAKMPLFLGGSVTPQAVERSRYVKEKIVFPPYESPAFIERLLEVGKAFEEKPVLLTDNDKPILAFSRHRKILSMYYRFLLPDEALIEALVDKRGFAALAAREGLPVPRTFLPSTVKELREIAAAIRFPCILKPAHQDLWKETRLIKTFFNGECKKAVKVHDAAELITLYEKLQPFSPEMIVQEFVAGRDEQLYDLHAYLNARSEVIACFVGRKIRTYPIHFGMGCYTVGVIDQEVKEIGLDALRRIGYQGIASINLKRDPMNGSVKILEINPRCSLWNHLATRSGVNIPALAYSDLVGQEWKIEDPHRIGYYWWNVKEDLKALIEYRRVGEWTLGQWIRSLFTKKECHVFAWRDPIPTLYNFLLYIRIRFKRLFKPA